MGSDDAPCGDSRKPAILSIIVMGLFVTIIPRLFSVFGPAGAINSPVSGTSGIKPLNPSVQNTLAERGAKAYDGFYCVLETKEVVRANGEELQLFILKLAYDHCRDGTLLVYAASVLPVRDESVYVAETNWSGLHDVVKLTSSLDGCRFHAQGFLGKLQRLLLRGLRKNEWQLTSFSSYLIDQRGVRPPLARAVDFTNPSLFEVIAVVGIVLMCWRACCTRAVKTASKPKHPESAGTG